MRKVAATVALLALAVPALAGMAAWSGCALPEPPRCCCPGDDQGCGCGCGAGRAPARTPEPVAPLPQAPEQGLAPLVVLTGALVSNEPQLLTAGRHDRAESPTANLLLTICTFRC